MSELGMDSDENEFQNANESVGGDNLHKTYLFGLEGVAALRGVSVSIRQGEFVMILGNSGGGKTSLLNILGTIDRQTKGNLQIYGQKIRQSTPDQILSGLRLSHIGFVFQTFNLIGSLTAKQNVELPMILKGQLSPAELQRRAESLLESVGMGHRLKHFPNQLSGGEQQRVTIARALANRPKMLLLDEPTGDLDSRNSLIVLDILLRLNVEEKITLVMVTHDVNLKHYAHRVIKVLDGKIIAEEKIQRADRQLHIINLRKQVVQLQQPRSELQQSMQRRQVEQYGAIKWLRQKQLRDKVQKELMEKVRIQLAEMDLKSHEHDFTEESADLM